MRTPPRPSLWLPMQLRPEAQPANRGSLEFMVVTLSYEQVYGGDASQELLAELLAPYSLQRIVDTACRASATLHRAPLAWDPETQWRICQGIFGQQEAGRLLEAAKRVAQEMGREDKQAPPLLAFHERQILNLLKAAFLLKSQTDEDSGGDLIRLGKAFLVITDLTEPTDLPASQEEDPECLDKWLLYMLANGFSTAGETGSHALARSYHLYLTDQPGLRDSSSYVNLPAQIASIHGLDPEALWSATFALISHWASLSQEQTANAPMAVNRDSYFTSKFAFTRAEVDSYFALTEADVDSFKSVVANQYTLDDLRPFHFLPFAQTPLVSFDNRVQATSVQLLFHKLTSGLHYLHLDPRTASEDRQRYLTYMGDVFEDYVHQVFNRAFPEMASRYVKLDDMRPELAGKYRDGLLSYGDDVILVETKASIFSLEARTGNNLDQVKSRLADIYLDGARQLEATARVLRDGLRDEARIIPDTIRRIYPVIETLEDVAMNPVIAGEIRRMLETENLLADSAIAPMQGIDSGDLEQTEAVLDVGASFRDLLKEKIDGATDVDDSWSNFFYRKRDDFPDVKNVHLRDLFTQLADSAREFFRERGVEDAI
jgi:hypothetical protein